MTQRYCESCGNLFDSASTAGVTPKGRYLCPNCAAKQAGGTADSPEADGAMMEKGAGLKKSVGPGEEKKLTFRCPNCNALLSSRKIDKRSRLTCPKCNEKVIINPDGTAELLAKRAPHMKKMEIPQKEKLFSDRDLERLLDFGETQPIGRDTSTPAPKPRPPSGRKEPAQAPAAPAAAAAAPQPPDEFSGPQYVSDEEEERLKFLDQMQGPGGKKRAAGPEIPDAQVQPPVKKGPPARKKLARFGTDRHKSESVEDRMETARLKRASTRNKVLAIIFIVLPLLVGVIAYYNAGKQEEGEESGFGKLVRAIGRKAKSAALAVNERVLHQEVVVTEQPAPEEPKEPAEEPKEPAEEPKEPAEEPKEPAEEPKEPAEEPKEPAEEPKEPAEEPKEPAEQPKEPAEEPKEPAEEPKEPAEEPKESAGQPAGQKPEVEIVKCPNCGKPIRKTDLKCPWCGQENTKAPKKDNPPTTH